MMQKGSGQGVQLYDETVARQLLDSGKSLGNILRASVGTKPATGTLVFAFETESGTYAVDIGGAVAATIGTAMITSLPEVTD